MRKDFVLASVIVIAVVGLLWDSTRLDDGESISGSMPACFAICLFLISVALVIVQVVRRKFQSAGIWSLATLTSFVGIAVIFTFNALPDVAGRIEEAQTISMLTNRADEDTLQKWFSRVGAAWHFGEEWAVGNAYYPSSEPACDSRFPDCSDNMQVAFTHGLGMCVSWGDRITMHFDKHHKLKTWS